MSFSKGMTLKNVPAFDGPHTQTSPLHQVGDSFLSVFSKRWARDPGCISSMNRWGGGKGQIRQAGTTKVLIDSISVNTECARSRAPCPRVNADAVALKTRKPAAKQAISQDRWSPPTESYPRSQRLDFLL